MRSDLILTPTTGMDRSEWLAFRKRGIGASDVGTIMGLNQYKCSLELFYERLGPQMEFTLENIARFMGHYHEDGVADLWQYWGGDIDSMIANFAAGKKVRKCQRVNAYVQNPLYPHLFVSLDRKINKGTTGKEGALEIKTIAGYEANKWESGIPPSHVVQVQTQMLVCGFEYGEIAAMKDGRQIDVYEFELLPNVCNAIIEQTTDFWERVQKGRVLLTQKFNATMEHNMRAAHEFQAQLEALEPEPDGSEAYERYMKDKYKKSIATVGLIPGTEEDYENAKQLLQIKEQIKELDDRGRLFENILKRRLADHLVLDFGKRGKITWQGTPRTFRNQIKL